MNIKLDEITVKIKFIEGKNLKAIITLDFGDFLVKGFRVLNSDYKNCEGDKLWLVPPSYQDSGGQYHPIFFCPDKEGVWQPLEKKVWDEYYKQSEKYYKKRFNL